MPESAGNARPAYGGSVADDPLPAHLDYDEVNAPDEDDPSRTAYPEVRCTIAGCGWTYDAAWSDLDPTEPDTPDWNALHPAHEAEGTRMVSVREDDLRSCWQAALAHETYWDQWPDYLDRIKAALTDPESTDGN